MWNTRTKARLHPEDTKTPDNGWSFASPLCSPAGPCAACPSCAFRARASLFSIFWNDMLVSWNSIVPFFMPCGPRDRPAAPFRSPFRNRCPLCPQQATQPVPGRPMPGKGQVFCPFLRYTSRGSSPAWEGRSSSAPAKKDAPQQQDVLLYASSSRQEKSFGALSAYLDAASRLLWASTNAL